MESVDENLVIEFLEEVDEVSLNMKTQVNRVSDLFFAETIQQCGSILFEKKQTPQVKEQKKQALKEIMDNILIQKNLILSEDQIYKKMNNMKARVKAKRSDNKELNEGEKMFLHLMTTVEKSNISTYSHVKFGCDDEGRPSDVEPKQPKPVIVNKKTTKLGIGDEAQPDDDVVQAQSKRVKLSLSNETIASPDFLKASVSVNSKLDNADQCKHQTVPGDRSGLDISELKKMVLLKKLDVLDLEKSFYEKAHNFLDLLSNEWFKK